MTGRHPEPPWWYRAATGGLGPWAARWGQAGDEAAVAQRLGYRAPAADLWLHAASVGEVAGALPLVAEIGRRRPAERLYLTALTPSGRRALRQALPSQPVGAPPVDSPRAVGRALEAAAPRRLLLFETELWPVWLAEALRRGVRVAVANARLSDRAWPRYRRFAELFRPQLARLTAVAAQSEVDAARWLELGADPAAVRVTGSGKFDAEPEAAALDASERRAARGRLGLDPERLWLVWGSLRPGEERRLMALRRALGDRAVGLLAVPRHPERWPAAGPALGDGVEWLGRLGVLAEAYRAADVALVGGTFEDYGGHNPIEPARLGLPVVLGRSIANCRPAAEALLAAGGARQAGDDDALAAIVRRWCDDAGERAAAGERARAAVQALRGGSTRACDWLEARGFWA